MSGNIKTINRSVQKDSIIFAKWHEQNHGSCHNEHHKTWVNDKNKFLLLGTPNVGKSTFFNKITTATAMVSNIDRMTVQNTVGRLRSNKAYCMVDLPGVYNLSHPMDEEMVVAHEIFHENFSKIANIIGAQSIERDLMLTIQCLETGMLSTVMINMIDEINQGAINYQKMSKMLNNVKIVPTQANRWRGIKEASHSIINDATVNGNLIKYPSHIEELISKISSHLPNLLLSKRFIALMILENNVLLIDELKFHYGENWKHIDKMLKGQKNYYNEINETRKLFITKVMEACTMPNEQYYKHANIQSHKLDHILLNKWIGIPLFLIMIALIYFISFGPWTGGALQTLFYDNFLIGIVGDKGLHPLFDLMNSPAWVTGLFVDGVFVGLFAVLSFIPVIAILFILVNIINQVGIISRISVLLDQTFARFGISGRSIVNLLTGFGCNVPAIMMARSSSSKKERVISILIAPFIACSARIIVFSFICNLIFGSTIGWVGMIGLTISSGLIALFVGLFFSKTMFRKTKSFFLIEMVSWRKPDFHVIAKSVWLELKEFIKKATLLIAIANLFIWLMLHLYIWHRINEWNSLVNQNNQGLDQSLMYYIGQGVKYLFYPVGFYGDDGWKLTVSLLSALPAKEIVISNFKMLDLSASITIAQGLSYLILIMAFFPCSATLSILQKEGGWKILRNHLIISTTSMYVLATIVYWIAFGICY